MAGCFADKQWRLDLTYGRNRNNCECYGCTKKTNEHGFSTNKFHVPLNVANLSSEEIGSDDS